MRLEEYVLGFLLASFVTLWAVLGQFFITAFVLRELVDLGPLPSSAATAFIGVIILLAAPLLVYSFVTIYFTVKKQVNHHRKWLSMKQGGSGIPGRDYGKRRQAAGVSDSRRSRQGLSGH